MSPSSAEVTYHPTGPGHRARTAQVDLTRIPDPEAWLTNRLGPLARFEIRLSPGTPPDEADRSDVEGLDALAFRRSASMHGGLATPRPAPAARAALEAATSTLPHPSSSTTQPKEAHL